MNQSTSKPELALKIFLSLFLVYHLAVIIILPNSGSYLGRSTEKWITPYANYLGLNTTWNFFSPDPAQTMFVKYTVWFDDLNAAKAKDPVEGFIPPEKEKIVLDSSKRRLLYAMRFLILDTNRMKTILAPWLCRENPGAQLVKIEHILEAIPNLEKAGLGEERASEGRQLMELSYECNGSHDEEVL